MVLLFILPGKYGSILMAVFCFEEIFYTSFFPIPVLIR
ncbi:hypothetical protein DCCM_2498 [Desulfocucumis palustris]|uniref:Uncharacterized protein n=1 Tax=Desulfocucumis palustris TaxID=1898651 RepID=A0A2L2XAU6_9FIRM|nr:hypothetical protein DCCM_2498 [Desulfocucumis palustris]